jgi:hypothetical protein
MQNKLELTGGDFGPATKQKIIKFAHAAKLHTGEIEKRQSAIRAIFKDVKQAGFNPDALKLAIKRTSDIDTIAAANVQAHMVGLYVDILLGDGK